MIKNSYEQLKFSLIADPATWLITGAAGFIGSNLLEALLSLDQRVVGLDNLSTGFLDNLDQVKGAITKTQWANFYFIEGDLRTLSDCHRAMKWTKANSNNNFFPVDYVLHQGALGSVPRSISEPITTNTSNITGFLNMIVAARDAGVKSFVYAASSSTYGDHPALPKIEDKIGKPLSPYAVTKLVNELYADVFARCYDFKTIGLRYFNVFGKRQDPRGGYAAVIPKWISSILRGDQVIINGDGETSRDFCYVENVIQANLLAATTTNPLAINQVYNIAVGEQTSLNGLYDLLKRELISKTDFQKTRLIYGKFRDGDIRHSLADISKAETLLDYVPHIKVSDGITATVSWYLKKFEEHD